MGYYPADRHTLPECFESWERTFLRAWLDTYQDKPVHTRDLLQLDGAKGYSVQQIGCWIRAHRDFWWPHRGWTVILRRGERWVMCLETNAKTWLEPERPF